jgi:hypothetical protein
VNLREIKQCKQCCNNFTAIRSELGWHVYFDIDENQYVVKTKRSQVRDFKSLDVVARYIADVSSCTELTDFKVVL